MMRRLLVGAWLASLAWTAVPALAATGATAASVVDVGWWTRQPGAEAQPGDGFEVALGIDGDPQSVAALRMRAQGGLTSARLTLTEAGGSGQDDATLRVCRTAARWSEADPGAYEDAPKPSCASSAELTREGTEWTAEVASLLPRAGGTASLMIVPVADPGAALPVGPGYAVEFSRAKISATASQSSPGTGVAVAPTTTAPPPATAPESGGGSDDTAAPAAAGSGVDSGASALDAGGSDPGVDDTSAADLGSDPTSGAAAGGSGKTKAAAGSEANSAPLETGDMELATDDIGGGGGGGGTPRPWGRLAVLIPLSAAAGAVAVRLRKLAQQRGLLANGG